MAENAETKDSNSAQSDSFEDLREQFQFEQLLADLAAIFVNLPHDQVDQEIEKGLALVADFLGADRGGIWQYSKDGKWLTRTHTYTASKAAPHPYQKVETDKVFLWFRDALQAQGIVVYEDLLDQLPEDAVFERQFCEDHGIQSFIMLPLSFKDGGRNGVIDFVFIRNKKAWHQQCIHRVEFIGRVFASVLRHKENEIALEKAFCEIQQLKERLEAENVFLKEEVRVESSYGDILGHSKLIKEVMNQVEQVAPTDSTVLIQGETGTGKELIARAIHSLSPRHEKTMVRVNCAAIPPTLIESELFGHEKGAFTGAVARRIGRFEIANNSTLFLDEIGELPADMQAKLLHVLEMEQFERIGSTETIDIDIRVVAATNKDLAEEVKTGNFREDLFYRLNIFPIQVPPLRLRKEDISMLVWAFVQEFSIKMGKIIQSIPEKSMEQLQNYPWPGNVRELRNVIERSMILTTGKSLHVAVPNTVHSLHPPTLDLATVEKNHILDVLSMTRWKVRGQNGAAELLALKPSTLESRMQKLGIQRPN